MGDSMPKPKDLSRECEHTWANVIHTEKKTIVESENVVLSKENVFFCTGCNTVLSDL